MPKKSLRKRGARQRSPLRKALTALNRYENRADWVPMPGPKRLRTVVRRSD